MKPARFDYIRAGTLAEAHDVLAAQGDEARIIAGGQSLVPMLSMRVARPTVLIDIMHLPELAKIEADDKAIRIGAGVRQAELLSWPDLRRKQPLLAAALPWVGHAQTRSRGTVCGSIAHADPSAELPLRPAGAQGRDPPVVARRASAASRADELLHRHDVDRARRRRNDRGRRDALPRGRAKALPSANSAAATAISPSSPAPPWRAKTACASPSAASPTASRRATFPISTGSALDDALDAFAWELDARDDLHATATYRRNLVRQLGRATIEEARACRA